MIGRQLSILLVICLAACVGCGGPSYGTPVTIGGKVTVGGQPPKDANIIFQGKGDLPADKRTVQAEVNPDGTYEIENVYPAEYQVFLQGEGSATTEMASAVPSATASSPAALPVDENGAPVMKPAKVDGEKKDLNFEF